MRIILGTLAMLALSTATCFAQQGHINFNKLVISQLPSRTSQAQVAQRLGQPLAAADPHYECGQYAS